MSRTHRRRRGTYEARAISVGCADLPPGMSRRVTSRSSASSRRACPPTRCPSQRIMRRWRTEVGDGELALVAPRGAVPASSSTRIASRARAAIRARALAGAGARHAGAAVVLFATPPSLTPSTAHRDRLRRLLQRCGQPGALRRPTARRRVRVWQPDGLWRPARGRRASPRELGVVAASTRWPADPLEDGGPRRPGDIAYARVAGMGRPSRPLGDDDLARLAEWLEPCRRGFVSFDTQPAQGRDAQGWPRVALA